MQINGVVFVGEYCILHEENGLKTITFDIFKNDPCYIECSVESKVEESLSYKISRVSDNGKYISCECMIDLDQFKETKILSVEYTDKKLDEILSSILPSEWILVGSVLDDKKTFTCNNVSVYDIIIECSKQFNVYFEFDNIKNEINIVYPSLLEYNGNYITEQLNILSTNYKSDTYKLFTRLYAYGKDGLTFETINGGKNYVENYMFTNKTIASIITDNSIEDKNKLLELANKTLNENCIPSETFTFKLFNLSKLDNNDFSLKNIKVHSIVKYLDRIRKREVFHRVVKYKEYPRNPSKDEITLSSNITTNTDVVISTASSISKFTGTNDNAYELSKAYTNNIVNSFKNDGYIIQDGNSMFIVNKIPKEQATFIIKIDNKGISHATSYSGVYSLILPISQNTLTTGVTGSFVFTQVVNEISKNFEMVIKDGLIREIKES